MPPQEDRADDASRSPPQQDDQQESWDLPEDWLKQWAHRVLFDYREGKGRYLVVPLAVLEHGRKMGLGSSELLFLLNLMSFKWREDDPYPSFGTLADRLDLSVDRARGIAQDLEKRGFLERRPRSGQTSAFNVQPFLNQLAARVGEDDLPADREAAGD